MLLCWAINQGVLSQISFSIPPGLVPGRISILITTLLILINISASAREKMPPSESLSLIDTWLGLCTIFVTLAIFEYAVVIWVKHHWITPPGRRDQTLKVSQCKPNLIQWTQHSYFQVIDQVSTYLFPTAFVVVSAGYWTQLWKELW